MTMRVDLIAGARPNLMKVAPLFHLLREQRFGVRLVHTGQHYDRAMSQVFFEDFGLPTPDLFFDVRGHGHAEQTGRIMQAYEPHCLSHPADLVVVVGDVNSTVACAITAKKCGLMVAHLEAGLRSGDRSMPEEINRILTDSICDLAWTHSPDADDNLVREGHPPERIQRVGNIMIDAYEMVADRVARAVITQTLGLKERGYGVVTFHRPANVDDPQELSNLANALAKVASSIPLVFPVHPRTRKRLESGKHLQQLQRSGVLLIEPLGYIDFMSLLKNSAVAVTDSGGIQEEASYLGVRCLTVRDTTERPITITAGTNKLISLQQLPKAVDDCLAVGPPQRPVIPLWDGRTAYRIVNHLADFKISPR